MDVVNFPGIIAEHGLLSSPQVDLAKDLILIGKKMGPQRDGTQYENMAITIAQFANLVSGGGNETLAQTLALGNLTGGNNIIFSGTDFAIFQSGAFTGRLSRLALTGNHAWNLPNQSGTIALLSDIPAAPTTLYSGNGSVTNRTVTITDDIRFNYVSGTKTTQLGVGADPFGWGQGGILNYFYDTAPGNVDAWGGLFDDFGAGSAAWLHEVYNPVGDSSGFFAGYSVVQTNPYSSIYHFEAPGGTYRGFEANIFGEQIYSQRLGLVTTPLTAADRVMFLSNAGGYIKATTYADLAALLPTANIYNANGVITDNLRTVQVRQDLRFNHGAAGVNGYFQMLSGGYFKAQTQIATNYLEYNNVNGVLLMTTDTHTVTGTRFINGGGVGNPESLVELFAGGNGTAYLNTGVTTGIFYILNNGGLSATNYTSSNTWSFGNGLPDHSVGLTVYGKGGTSATASQVWKNSSGTEQARFLDSGGLAIGINSLTGGFANAEKLRVEATVSTDYTNTVVFNQTYSNTVNNGNTAATLTTQLYKATAFNVGEMKAVFNLARNDGSGGMNFMYGTESMVWAIGAAAINYAFAYSARVQVRDGVIGNIGGLDISYQENNAPAVVTNMIGVLVRTPVNVAGITVTNTYGMLVQPNAIGTNNYGFVSSGNASNGLGTLTPSNQALLELASTDKAFLVMRMTAAQAGAITPANGMILYVTDSDATFPTVGGGFYKYQAGAWLPF